MPPNLMSNAFLVDRGVGQGATTIAVHVMTTNSVIENRTLASIVEFTLE